jgi:hypothetical protein
MGFLATRKTQLAELFADRGGVLDTATVLTCMTSAELGVQVRAARWQRPGKGVVVAHSGPLTDEQLLRVALLRSGAGAALGGLTAARLHGFKGFADVTPSGGGLVHVLVRRGFKMPAPMPGLNLVAHHTKYLGQEDVHPNLEPRRTRMPRALIDAAVWMPTDRGALAVLASGIQQRCTRVGDLREVIDRTGARLPRKRLILDALTDIEGGAQALSELDFTRKVIRRFGLPEPSRQAGRTDERGRQRWVDVVWEDWKVAVEVDGSQHTEALQYWDDMDRENDLKLDGYLVLRFPAWVVRRHPELVARKILQALRTAGYKG